MSFQTVYMMARGVIKEIIVDPRFKVNYASYYLYGLKSLLGSRCIKYRCIPDIRIETDKQCRIGFAMLVKTSNEMKRIYIDYGDWNQIDEHFYRWADLYAKINVRPEDAERKKLMVIGPSFGVKLWSPLKSIFQGLKNYHHINKVCGSSFKRSFKHYLMDYGYMFVRRKRYCYYHRFSTEEQSGYVFSFNTLWYGDQADNTTNRLRGDFMRECRRLIDHFDGGFFYNGQPGVIQEFPKYKEYLQEYSDLIYMKRMPMNEYDRRNRKSWFVFNTPSVSYCHGWKLAEFLCEGKAIISTHLVNLMPGNFTNGIHFLEATTREEMANAIILLRDNKQKVKELKTNAYHFFEDYLTPESVIRRIFNHSGLFDSIVQMSLD